MLTALIAYLHYEAPVEEQNFATLLEMLNTMQVLEDDEEYQNPVDLLFEELAKRSQTALPGGSTNFTSWLPVLHNTDRILIQLDSNRIELH